jgi:predicted O-linked N-acetylglucosamine transferase (SPINDLY family)
MIGKFNEAIDSYQRAIKINPEYAEAYNNLGNVYDINEKVDEAILNYKKAIKINANFVEAYSNLGHLLKEIGKVDEARNCENKLLSLKPNDIGYRINITLSIIPVVSSVEEINFYRNEYQKGLELLKKYQYLTEKPGDTITTNFFHLGYHARENLELMKNTSDLFRQIIPNINYVSKNIDKQKKQKKIKVGFISEFLTKHTVGKLFGGLIKNMDKKKFDIIIFHTYRTKKSLIKNEIDSHSNKVINLSNRIKEQHEQVEKENLDIIFYPEIGMSPITYFLAFARLAPAQIVSWGHPETTGINTIDYFLSSTLLEPNNVRRKYSERLICLSQFPLYYEPPQNLGTLKNRKDLKLPENVRLYGCPQSLFKLHPDFDSILAEILDQDPEGRIILIGGEGKKKYWLEILKKRWSKNFPILNKKVLFTNTLSLLEFISLCKCVNVLLDPIHFGGGNSFLETMLVGTPSITMPGTHLKTNITAAAYKQMKISKPPIVQSSKEYINLAIELAQDDKKNLSLREESKTAANKHLYNNLKALKEFEQFLEEAHTTAQSGNKLKDGYKIRF